MQSFMVKNNQKRAKKIWKHKVAFYILNSSRNVTFSKPYKQGEKITD